MRLAYCVERHISNFVISSVFFLNTHEFKILPFKNYEWITSSEGVEENIEKLFIS